MSIAPPHYCTCWLSVQNHNNVVFVITFFLTFYLLSNYVGAIYEGHFGVVAIKSSMERMCSYRRLKMN